MFCLKLYKIGGATEKEASVKDHLSTLWNLNGEETKSTNALKNTLMSPPVLALPNSIGHTTLDTDASTVEIEFVLQGVQEVFE